ncbi:MAG: hypothetical protein RBR50_00245 [Candidatus Izemoplasmatales bacterium]|nr:hypothetical protein [Candidatus Izemoplasmatales bacterium]
MKNSKILIISALPFNDSSVARAFNTYFLNIKKENLFQFYVSDGEPDRSKCCEFLKINERDLLFRKSEDDKINRKSIKHKSISNSFFVNLLRSLFWRIKKTKYTGKLIPWLEKNKPDVLFFHNSDALFMLDLALFIKKQTKKPLVFEISDDYFFNNIFSLNPFYLVYRLIYKFRFKKLMRLSSYNFYISDKMKIKYDDYFSKKSSAIYLSSTLQRGKESINGNDLYYFGNVYNGRDDSLLMLSKTLIKIDKNAKLHVYLTLNGKNFSKKLLNLQNVILHDSVSYADVVELSKRSKALVLTEGFKKRDIKNVKFSLSTKISDSLISNRPLLAFGPKGGGSIDFLCENKCGFVATNENELAKQILILYSDYNNVQKRIEQQVFIFNKYFSLKKNGDECSKIFEELSNEKDSIC